MKIHPTILAIDSTSGACSVAVWRDGAVAAYREELTTSAQAKLLIPMIEEVLADSGVGYAGLSAVAVTIGPGSFTGIRIGLATARGVGFAAKIPVLGFNALEILAFGEGKTSKNQQLTAVMNAGKGELVYQDFDSDFLPICEPTLIKSGEQKKFTHPRADHLAQYAALYPDRCVAPLPFYIRPPDAKLPS